MRNLYRSILPLICVVADRPWEELELHKQLKFWYGIKTTTQFTKDDWYNYLERVFELCYIWYDLWFDVDLYRNVGVKCIYNWETFYNL